MPPQRAQELLTATSILLGLRFSSDIADQLIREATRMKESTVYQAILAEGEAKGRAEGEVLGEIAEARRTILRLGEKRFGLPDAAIRKRVRETKDLTKLHALEDRLLEAESWDELFATGEPNSEPSSEE
jgi:predicted transposase YdaD